MKKVLAMLLVVVMCVTVFSGCTITFGSPSESEPEAENTVEAGNSVTDNTTEEVKKEEAKELPAVKNDPSAKVLNLNETITVGNAMEVTFESGEWVEQINPSKTDGFYSYIEDVQGEKYFVVKGKIKNLSGEDLDISYHGQSTSLLINNTYKADVYARAEETDGTGFYGDIKPLQTLNVVFYASVSDELQAIWEKIDVNFKLVNDAAFISEYFYDDKTPHDTYTMTFNK